MQSRQTRRQFIETSVAGGLAAGLTGLQIVQAGDASPEESNANPIGSQKSVIVNDDAYVFLWLSDELDKDKLRRYLQSYCRPGVTSVAYCVGDMSWPTLYPTKVGTNYSKVHGSEILRNRGHKNVARFETQPGGYYGAAFEILHELGKKVLASFRMNDAHLACDPENPYLSDFHRQHQDLTLGPEFGYYRGSLNYAHEVVRDHFFNLVMEFMELYPQVDGVELDAMRSPFFFPKGRGRENAPLFTELIHRIQTALAKQAKRLSRPDYSLSINLPRTPNQAIDWGLDAASWDRERLFEFIAVGPYLADMTTPIAHWKAHLKHNTPIYSYINLGMRSNGYALGLEEYRAAAANGYGGGADGMYLFNFPYFLASQSLASNDKVEPQPETPVFGQPDLTKIGQTLDEIGQPNLLRDKDKTFLFYFNADATYRQTAPVLAGLDRQRSQSAINAPLLCYEDYDRARQIKLRFKLENATNNEQFQTTLNGRPIESSRIKIHFVAEGRQSKVKENVLGPYLEFEVVLMPNEFHKGENTLDIIATKIDQSQTTKINLTEIELHFAYA